MEFDQIEAFYDSFSEYMKVKHQMLRSFMHIKAEQVMLAFDFLGQEIPPQENRVERHRLVHQEQSRQAQHPRLPPQLRRPKNPVQLFEGSHSAHPEERPIAALAIEIRRPQLLLHRKSRLLRQHRPRSTRAPCVYRREVFLL